jgi:hypothetical protein
MFTADRVAQAVGSAQDGGMDYRITAIPFTPAAALSAPVRATLRGSRSRRIIEIGGVLRPEDGDLELTFATEGEEIPSCAVALVLDGGEEERAIAAALFGWLP